MSDAVARRYAQAVIELAADGDVIDRVGADLETFVTATQSGGGALADALSSPVFTVEERRAVLAKILPKMKVHALTANLLYLANDKRRLGLVPQIARAYRGMADDRAGRVRVRIEAAEPLSSQLESEVQASLERMTGKTVVLEITLRPELIAGIVARVGDKVYDSSLRTRLESMRQSLLRSPIAEA